MDSNKDLTGIRHFTITGNLDVNGTTTTIDSTTVSIKDKNMVLANNISADPATDAGVNGAGLTIGTHGSAPSMTWNNGGAVDYFEFNKPLKLVVDPLQNVSSLLDFGTYTN